jgi:hypothetical protein
MHELPSPSFRAFGTFCTDDRRSNKKKFITSTSPCNTCEVITSPISDPPLYMLYDVAEKHCSSFFSFLQRSQNHTPTNAKHSTAQHTTDRVPPVKLCPATSTTHTVLAREERATLTNNPSSTTKNSRRTWHCMDPTMGKCSWQQPFLETWCRSSH